MAHSHAAGHDHDHDHSHAPTVTTENERKVLLGFAITFSFMLVEVVGGLLSGSLALIADAGHMVTDAAALALAYAAFRLGRRAADAKRTFGYLRLEVVAGLFNAFTLFVIVIWIGYEAWSRLMEPYEVLAGPMLVVAVIGLAVNLLVFWILNRGGSDHVNIKGASLHVLGDLLGSVGAILAALVIYATGWTPIDPLLSVVVALLILRSAWSLFGKSAHILLEGAPDDAQPAEIERHLLATVPNLAAVRHVHVWLITSGRKLGTMHVKPTEDRFAQAVVRDVERQLADRFSIEHATVAIDWTDGAPACSLSGAAAPGSKDGGPHDGAERTGGGAASHQHDHDHAEASRNHGHVHNAQPA